MSSIVLAQGEEADIKALNRLPALNLIRGTKLHLSTESVSAKRLLLVDLNISLFSCIKV
jgi:phosphotransferase system HPr-like phosphotransfer protein